MKEDKLFNPVMYKRMFNPVLFEEDDGDYGGGDGPGGESQGGAGSVEGDKNDPSSIVPNGWGDLNGQMTWGQ